MRKLWFFVLSIMVTGVVFSTITVAQDDSTCPILVQTAIDSVTTLCSGTGRNQVCYGNVQVTAAFSDASTNIAFSEPGDIANLVDIEAIQLSGMDIDANEWGVAMMQVQANLPDTLPGQNVTFVLFGDVEIETVPAPPELLATVSASGAINVRSGPGTTYGVVDAIASGTALIANGRNDSADWLRVTLPETDDSGWIAASLLRPDGDTADLQIVEPDTPIYAPMQAFYLRSGVGDSRCVEAPGSGLLIQTPQGAGEIQFSINEVQIRMGSTVFFQAEAGNQMSIYVLEGQARVAAFDVSRTVPAGASVSIPLDESAAASGPPGDVEPYDTDAIQAMPVVLLPDMIEAASPLSEADIAALDICTVSVSEVVNTRGGPGIVYGREGALAVGTTARIIGQADGTDNFVWWQLEDERWVRSDVVGTTGNCGDVQVVVDLPPVPAGTSSGTIYLSAPICPSGPMRTGTITLAMGYASAEWHTCEQVLANIGQYGFPTFSGNGPSPYNYRYESFCHGDPRSDGMGTNTLADVDLEPGVYTYTGTWNYSVSCTFTVIP